MGALSGAQLLELWDRGADRGPTRRALLLLGCAAPQLDQTQLDQLSLGQRDLRLIDLHERLVGPTFQVYAECPHCQERLEFPVAANELRSMARQPDPSYICQVGEIELGLRVPNSADLLAAEGCASVEQARARVLERCVLSARRADTALYASELAEGVVATLAASMLEQDPLAEVLLELACPACDEHWQVVFDTAEFLWGEVAVRARRLVRDVHALASAYGWHEADILALSPARRRAYLELIGA